MTTRRALQRPVIGAGILVLAVVASPNVASAHWAQAPPQTSIGAVRAAITAVAPVLTGDPSSMLGLRATFHNDSVTPVTRVRWRLRIAPAVSTRVGLTTAFGERGESTVLWRDNPQVIDVLNPGERREVVLYLRLDQLEDFPAPDEPAIFPLRFEVTHRLENTLAVADTFLIWNPAPQPTLRIGWLVPITDPPARDASFAIRGEALEQSVSPGGRLDAIVTALDRGDQLAGAALPITLAIDAETVESVTAIATGSTRVAADGSGAPTQRAGSPAAAAWLARLKRRAARHPVIALPYADADIVALVRAGLSSEMTAALHQGRARLDALLGITSRADIAWPVGEVADAATTDELADNGVQAVVLDRTAVRSVGGRGFTSTAASDLETGARRITAIVPDAPLTSLASDVMAGGLGLPVAQQRLLAETAVIQQERPSEERDVFVSFARDWHPTELDAAAALLSLPARTGWLGGTTLPQAVSRAARAADRVGLPRYPATARRGELPAPDLRDAHRLRKELRSFAAIVAKGEPPEAGATAADRERVAAAALDITTRLARSEDAMSWALSAHWRGNEAAGGRLRAAVDDVLRTLRGQVYVQSNALLATSTSAGVPITVFNRLGTPVRVRVSLQSQKLGLAFGPIPDIVVPAARSATQPGSKSVRVTFQAQRIGKFPVNAQLRTVDDVELGAPTEITVRTTVYGRVALLVTGGAFALFVLATLLRFVFRRRRDGRGDADTGDDTGDPDAGDAPPVDAAEPSESQPAASVPG